MTHSTFVDVMFAQEIAHRIMRFGIHYTLVSFDAAHYSIGDVYAARGSLPRFRPHFHNW